MAEQASKAASEGGGIHQTGLILTSNLLAGFALELGLKSFFMTYCEDGPPNTHDVGRLFRKLPEQIKTEIDLNYKDRIRPEWIIKSYAYKTSPVKPETPSSKISSKYTNASNFFENVSQAFVRSRYFFEEISGKNWSIFEHPIEHMLTMIKVIEDGYADYLSHGGLQSVE